MFTLLALLAGLVVVNTSLTFAFENRLSAQAEQETGLHVTAQVSERLLRSLDNQVVEVRGYALTGESTFLHGYAIQRITELRLVERLRRRLAGDEHLLERIGILEKSILHWRRRVADPIIAAVRTGHEQGTSHIETHVDERLFGAVRSDSRELSRGIGDRLSQIERAVEQSRERLSRQLLVSAALALMLVAGSAWALRRWITVPVAGLLAQVRRVSSGRLEESVQANGPVEFKMVGEAVELMRRRIMDDLEETRRAVEALEQNAPLVTSLRSQLRPTPDAPLPEGLQIVGRLEPAHGVLAGDWYDVVTLDEDSAVLIVVDVCGHGPQAGLRALWLKHLLVPALVMGLEPGEALNWVAGQMGDTGEWFATCVIVEIDSRNGRCRYANAGHPPPLVLGSDGVAPLLTTGTLFGALPGQRWRTAETVLGVHEMLVVYTDGITETRNAAGDEFGDDRLISCFRASGDRDPAAVADGVMQSVHAFGSERLDDDATLAVVKCIPHGLRRDGLPAQARPGDVRGTRWLTSDARQMM